MSLGADFNNACPLFDYANGGGVLFPYYPMSLAQAASNAAYINLDATASTIFARIKLPMKSRLITCEAFACSDDQGTKGAAATTEPIIGISYGTADLASVDAGTSIAVITCDATGAIGKRWAGTTTETTIETTEEVIVHLKTAASSGTSANQDGGAVPVLWFASVNSPA
jgi:hypothetical protein